MDKNATAIDANTNGPQSTEKKTKRAKTAKK